MARRKKNDSAANLLIALPWQVSAILGVIAFVGLRWILPLLLTGTMFLPVMRPLAHMVSWLAAFVFGILALMSYLKSHNAAASEQKFKIPESRGSTSRRAEPHIRPTEPKPKSEQKAAPIPPSEVISRPTAWSIEALRSLEWKRFELLCAKYYEMTGFKAETMRCGPDGGIDVKLFKAGEDKPAAIVQCKAWNAHEVGVKEIRELLGVMTHEKVERGIFATTGGYTKDAIAFGKTNPIEMVNGEAFILKISELATDQQTSLLSFAFDGDYRTPTCPSCGTKMVTRQGKRGYFFGCSGYPRCHKTFVI